MNVYKNNNKIAKCWIDIDDIEESALEQINNVLNLPFIHKHVALMPDVHRGFGCVIGSVVATKGVIIPSMIGVDIGCGMCAVKTSLKVFDIPVDTIKAIMGDIRKVIPVGFKKHQEMQDEEYMPYGGMHSNDMYDGINCADFKADYPIVHQEYNNARKSISSLGGGNHFVELQRDTDDYLWIMIHSGSRNLGYKVAKYYNDLAKDLNAKWYSSVPKKYELAFLPMGTQEAADYINEMNYCVEFALANRSLMMERIKEIIATQLGRIAWTSDFEIPPNVDDKESMAYGGHTVTFESMINIAHNYARLENHFGKNVWVHRKGATSAKEGEIGIIPGSQGTKSYIVRGLGNKESFESCSHGAGRLMGRVVAKKILDLAEQIAILDKQGIVHNIRNISDLDEAPGAYKDIDVVMKNQEDLVEIVTELTPIAVIKG